MTVVFGMICQPDRRCKFRTKVVSSGYVPLYPATERAFVTVMKVGVVQDMMIPRNAYKSNTA